MDPDAWYLSVDGGQTWYRITGDKGEQGDEGDKGDKGDSMFADDPKLSDDGTHWTFYLDGGTSFDVPAYQPLTIGDGSGMITLTATTQEITLTYPTGTEATDYRALVAQITPEGEGGTYTDIATRADDADGWSVEAKFNSDNTATLAITAGTSSNALLRVTLVKNDGSELAASCIVSWQGYTIDAETSTYTVYTPQGLLAWAKNSYEYNCTLAADIDMSGQTWPEIMTSYSRTFDGAGHIISNLKVTGVSPVGFIPDLDGGTVKNLLLVNATSNGEYTIGGITGQIFEGTVIACAVSRCTVRGKDRPIGGIAGVNDDTVTACYAASCTVEVENEGRYGGHIAGSTFGSINACYYDGDGDGIERGDGDVTQITDDNDWQAAAQDMNSQLAGNDYIWEVNPDEEARATLPLVLVPNPDVQ